MVNIIIGLHVVVCLFLIFVVLIQRGKGADMGAVFGGSTNTILGATGAVNLLQKLTTAAAILFMCTSLFLAWNSSKKETVFDKSQMIKPAPVAEKKEGAAPKVEPKKEAKPAAPKKDTK